MALNSYNYYPHNVIKLSRQPRFGEIRASEGIGLQGNVSLSTATDLVSEMLGLRHVPNYAHSYGVSLYSEAFANELGLDKRQQEVVKTAALLHDIGKIHCPDNFFNREIDNATRERYRRHPMLAKTLLSKVKAFNDAEIPEIIAQHHEHEDGNGFPKGLTGTNIRIEAKIIHIADSFDSSITPKYVDSTAYSPQEALDRMQKGAGTCFDRDLLDKFAGFVSRNKFAIVDEVNAKVNGRIREFGKEYNIPTFMIPSIEKRAAKQ